MKLNLIRSMIFSDHRAGIKNARMQDWRFTNCYKGTWPHLNHPKAFESKIFYQALLELTDFDIYHFQNFSLAIPLECLETPQVSYS